MQITQFTWTADSAIRRMDVRKLETGTLEAYLHAPETAGAGELAGIPDYLGKRGYSAVPDTLNGQNVLRISGFKSEDELKTVLSDGRFVQGEGVKALVGEAEHKPVIDRVRKQTVKLSGVFGIIGHAALGAVGVMQGDYKRVATSAFYTTSTLTSAIYGAGKDGGAGKVIKDMKEYLNQQGVKIPEGDNLTPEELAKKGGVIDTLHGYIKKHPLEIGNTVGLMGNVMLTYSGLKGGQKIEPARTASGLASMLGALTVILVQEKDKKNEGKFGWPGLEETPGLAKADLTPEQLAEKQENRSIFKKAADFVQERPMRTAGLLNVGGNLAMFVDAHGMRKNAQQGMRELDEKIANSTGKERKLLEAGYDKEKFKANATGALAFTTAATYLIATAFTSLSSKTKISDYNEKEMLGKLCAMSASLVAEQPQELRDEVIEKAAFYLSKKPDIKENQQEIADIINQKVDQLAQSPWAARVAVERAQAAHVQPNGVGA